tara:strand:+ start:475 stop:591 length:117 start_codon:yes stop_codon:yes gene_type:complete
MTKNNLNKIKQLDSVNKKAKDLNTNFLNNVKDIKEITG